MSVRIVAGQTKTIGVALASVANDGKFQVAPTIDANDWRISTNGGSFAALTNTPTVTPSGGKRVQITFAAAETTAAGAGGEIFLIYSDSSGNECYDLAIPFPVYANAEDTIVATVTNLTNAPTSGDLTATMKTSVTTAATAATPTAAAVTGAVGSISSPVTVGTNNDKSGYALATPPPTATAIRTELDTNSTKLDVAVGTRMATFTYTAPDNAGIADIEAAVGSIIGDGLSLSDAQRIAIADAVLGRSSSYIDSTASEDSLYEIIGMLLRASAATGQLVIKKTDGVTTFSTRSLETDLNAQPIVGVS